MTAALPERERRPFSGDGDLQDLRDTMGQREVSLVDLLDRVLGVGVVLTGSLTLSIADVDLVRVDLRALISSINENVPSPWEGGQPI